MHDPFAILGLPSHATTEQIRSAFRRLALQHHPDRNPDDPSAGERFKRVLRAYRAALHGPRGLAPAPSPTGPRPDRFGCASCGDTFPFPERCPRCGIALFDRDAGEVVAAEDPRVTEWARRMETRTPVEPSDERLPAPGLLAGVFVGAAVLIVSLGGPLGPALLFAGFAAYVLASEGTRALSLPWAEND
jgi:hypothetical protein